MATLTLAQIQAQGAKQPLTLAQLQQHKPAAAPIDSNSPMAKFNRGGAQRNIVSDIMAAPKAIVNATGFAKTADTLGTIVARATNPQVRDQTNAGKPTFPAPSKKDVAGAALNVGSLLFPVGGAEKVGASVLGKALPKAAATIGSKILAPAAAGYVYDAGQKLEAGKAPTPGAATALGAAIPVPGIVKDAAVAAGSKLANYAAPRIINSLIKPLSKGFSYGKNPGRAVAEEGIVANSMEELATKIASARQSVGARLQTAASQVQGHLAVPQHTLLAPFDNAITKAVENNDQTLLNRLNQAKSAITTVFGTDKEGKIIPIGSRLTDGLTYSQAVLLKQKVGDLTKWTGQQTEDETVNGALTRTYGAIKQALNEFADKQSPEKAAELRKLNEKYGDLTSAEIATKYRDVLQKRQNLINLPGKIGLGLSAVAAPFTGGMSTVVGAGASIAADKVLSSPAFKTRAASILAKVGDQAPKAAKTFTSPGDLLVKGAKSIPTELPVPRGMAKLPLVGPKIHSEDLATMSDFTDYVAGTYKPSAAEGSKLELDASRMWEHYFPNKKMPKSLTAVANEFGRTLEKNNFGKSQGRDLFGKYDKKK